MFSRFALLISFASLVLVGAMTISCGSSSSATKPTCTGGPYYVAGDWSINLTVSRRYPVQAGVISPAGLALFFDSAGDEIAIPGITGACSFSDNLTLYIGQVNFGGTYSYPVQGNVQPGPAITGTISEPEGPQSFVSVPLSPFTPTALNSNMAAVDLSSAVACLRPGCVLVQVVPSGTGNSADMTLSGTDGLNCYVSGTFAQEGSNAANLNAFDVSLTFTGTGCQVTGTINGLGFESPADYFGFTPYPPSGTFLYAMSANSANVFEFYP